MSGFGAHREADARLREIDAAALHRPALPDQLVQRGAGEDQHVGRLAAREALGDGVGRVPHGRAVAAYQRVAGAPLELGDQEAVGGGEAAGARHPDLGGRPRWER
jgi:hypothetical protein